MRLECEWRHARKRWSRELEILSQLGVDCGPCWETIELLPLEQRMEVSAIELSFYCCGGGLVFRVPTSEDELWSKTPRDVPNVEGIVSIVWLRKTFKNSVSLLVSKNWSQKLINAFVSEQRSPPVFCICLYLHLYMYYYDGRGWPVNCMTVISTRRWSNMPFQRRRKLHIPLASYRKRLTGRKTII